MDKKITLTEQELQDLMFEATKSYNFTPAEEGEMTMNEGYKSMILRLIEQFKNSKK